MLKVLSLEQADEWDSIVRSFKDYDVYWLSGYVRAFNIHGDGEPILFYYEGNNTRGINVVMKRDIADDERYKDLIPASRYFDFKTPYGYGGWIIEGEFKKGLFREYEKWCKNNRILTEFVRFHPIIRNNEYVEGYYKVIRLGRVVHIDLESREYTWNNFISQNRNKIRKAEKNGVIIFNGRYPEIFKQFNYIYSCTMDKDNATKYYYFSDEFFSSVMYDLPENAQIFYAVKDDKIIAASIMLMANKKINYHLSGSLPEYAYCAPVNLLLYKTCLWGIENGYKTLYLGGGLGSEEDNLFTFKRGFNRAENYNSFYIGNKVFRQDCYDELVFLGRDRIKDPSYFPAYRG